MSLQGKVALVTGASRGIGQAIALELGRQGAVVIGTATSPAGAERIAETLKANGIEGAGLVLDVSDSESVAATLEHIQQHLGQPLILVNNAGITRDNLMLRMKDDEWFDVINTNLNSLYRLSKAVLRGMTKARWGRIVNISSVVGATGNPGQGNYAASKAGMVAMTKTIARAYARDGILAFAICPGFTMTGMADDYLESRGGDKLLADIPLGRVAMPEEVGEMARWCALDAPASMTGAVLDINGASYVR